MEHSLELNEDNSKLPIELEQRIENIINSSEYAIFIEETISGRSLIL
jgi:hypothetical protein